MKIKSLSIVAVVLIMIVVASAGCSSKPKVGSTVSSSSVISTNYKWIEYRMWDDNDLKIEKSNEDYNGEPSVHEKITVGRYTYDIYFDKLMKNVLGGTETSTNAYGQTTTEDSNSFRLMPYSDLLGINKEIILTYEGSETVTVPAGTYSNADLYTNSTDRISTSYWMSSGVPVPVKIRDNFGNEIVLLGWG